MTHYVLLFQEKYMSTKIVQFPTSPDMHPKVAAQLETFRTYKHRLIDLMHRQPDRLTVDNNLESEMDPAVAEWNSLTSNGLPIELILYAFPDSEDEEAGLSYTLKVI